MNFKEKTAEELAALSVEELSLYYTELNDAKFKALEAKVEANAEASEIAEMRKEIVEKEINRLSTMDEVKAKILGISKDEILNG